MHRKGRNLFPLVDKNKKKAKAPAAPGGVTTKR